MKQTPQPRRFPRCTRRVTLFGAMIVSLAWMAPARVHAIGACVCEGAHAAPFFTREMPLNPRLFVWAANLMPGTIRLLSEGDEIPTAIEPMQAGGDALWVRPLASLHPSTAYTLIGARVEAP